MRGTVGPGSGSRKGKEGWRLALSREHLPPIVEHNDDLDALLCHLVGAAAAASWPGDVRDLAGTRPE